MNIAEDLRCFYSDTLRVAVTGATGFIGQCVVDTSNDVFSPRDFDDVPPETVIIHLASAVSASRATPQDVASTVLIDMHVVNAVRERHVALVYASGNNVYPFSIDCRVEDSMRCHDVYGAAKVFAEHLVRDLLNKPFSIVRIGDVFGRGQRHGNLFRAMEKAIREQSPLQKLGPGLKRRSYIYAPELALLLLDLATRLQDGQSVPPCINACYPESPSVGELVDLVAEKAGLTVTQVEMAQMPTNAWTDIRTMRPGPFGAYLPRWSSLETALASYVHDVKNHA